MKMIYRYSATVLATLFALVVVVIHLFFHPNLVNHVIKVINLAHTSKVDELVTPLLLIVLGRYIDRFRARQREKVRAEIQSQRLRVFKATMRTVQDLVNNFLNNLQLLRLEAEEGKVPPESLQLFDALVQDITEELKALGDLEETPEKNLGSGLGIDYGQNRRERNIQ